MKKVIFLLFIFINILQINANENIYNNTLRIKYIKPIEINASMHSINRIHFADISVTKIIGDSNLFKSTISQNGKDLFFTLKGIKDDVINISLQSTSGDIIDLSMKLVDTADPAYINLSLAERSKLEQKEIDVELSAREMMSYMSNHDDSNDKYFIEHNINKDIRYNYLACNINTSYQLQSIIGYAMKCKNIHKLLKLDINAQYLSGYIQNLLAVSASSTQLNPGDVMNIFVIIDKNTQNNI